MKAPFWRSLIQRFSRLNILVIGDLMLDHYLWGSVNRISPEAPVPVVEVARESEMPGGAGNVALNMAALGSQVHLVGLVGQDAPGERLLHLFRNYAVHPDGVVRSAERPTIQKSRIIAHHQQVVRVDREVKGDLPPPMRNQIWSQVERLLPHVQAVVLSDYGKGVISPWLIHSLIRLAQQRRLPVIVDPKIENFRYYRQVTCLTPNLQEAMGGAGVHSVRSEEDIERLGQRILKRLNARSVLITRGEKGMSLFERQKPPLHIPTRAQEVFDVTGAGDTVTSTLTLGLAAGAPLRASAELANFAAGVVVGKLGTATVTGEELLAAVGGNHARPH